MRVETVQMSGAAETFSFAVDSAPTAIILDPDTWLLFEGELSRRPGDQPRR